MRPTIREYSSRHTSAVIIATIAVHLSVTACVDEEHRVDESARQPQLALDLDADEGPLDIGAADFGEGVFDLPPEQLRGTPGLLPPEELAALGRAPGAVASTDAAITVEDWRTKLRDSVRGEPEDKEVLVLVALDDVKFPWFEFKNRGLSKENREELVGVRRQQLQGRLDELETRIASVGGEDITRYWIAPVVAAWLPARTASLIADWDGISDATRDDDSERDFLTAYRPGIEGRDGTRADNFIAADFRGQDGHLFGGSSLAVRAAVYDDLNLNYTHPGFKNADGASRIFGMFICFDDGTCPSFTPSLLAPSHANPILGLLGGSIEDGQDPNFTGATARRRRSGLSSGSRLYYYTSPNFAAWASMLAMIQDGLSRSIDIANHSWSTGNICSRTTDFNGANAALRNSMDGGMLHVIAVGNSGSSGCKVAWPATRPDALKVGALNTINNAQNYDTATMATYSSRGGMTILSNGSFLVGAHSLVDLVAPGEYELTYEWAGFPGGPYSSAPVGGTSVAAPSVAGNAVDLLNSFHSLGWSGMDPRLTQTYLLMMGDGYNADSGTITSSGMSSLSGAGRLKNHFMDSGDLVAPWAWGCHRQTFVCPPLLPCPQQSFTYGVAFSPHPAAITTWKAALTWTEPDLNDAAQLVLRVRNTCPAQSLVADTSADIRKRVKLSQSSISGKCLVYDVIATYIPTGSSRTFTVCDYLQSGNAGDH